MKLLALRFRHVGPFGADGISLEGFTAGLNVISETNEFGKSTVLKALETFLFKPFSSSDKQVKSLSSTGSGFGPMGEISFESGGQTYCLTKQFLKGKQCALLNEAGQVLATNREAEEKLAQLLSAEGHGTGPSGLLWVRQGASMDRVDDDGQVASRLEGELTTLVGGDRARDYLARVELELAENVTSTGREKMSGPLKLVREALAETDAALVVAIAKRNRTHDIGQALTLTQDEIGRLESGFNKIESAAEIQSTREAVTQAASHDADLKRLIAEQARAKSVADRATEKRDAHIEALTKYNRWTEGVKSLEAEQAEQSTKAEQLLKTRQSLCDEIAALEAQVATLSAQQKSIEEAATLKIRFDAAAREAGHFSALNESYQAMSTRLSDLDVRLTDLPSVKRSNLAELQTLTEEARQAGANISALTTRLFLDISVEGVGKVSIDGVTLSSGPVELTGDQVLNLEGIGKLRSDDSQLQILESRRKTADAELAAQLEQLGAADLSEARKIADQRHDLEIEQKQLVKDMGALAPHGVTSLLNNLEAANRLLEDLSNRLADIDISHEAPTESGDDLGQDLNAVRGRLDALDESLAKARESIAVSTAKLSGHKNNLMTLNIPNDEQARTEQADRYAAEKLAADSDMRLVSSAVETARAAAPTQSLDMLKSRLSRLEQVDRQTRETLEELKRKESSLQANRDAGFEGEDADAQVQILEDRKNVHSENLARLEHQVAAQTLLRDTLQAAQSRLRETYTEPVRVELAPLLARVIPGAEAHLNETLGADTVSRDGRIEDIAQLSGGTREQIAILTRLAFARLLKRSGADAPVILDDALVYADDKRRDDMFDVLNHVSSGEGGLQLIYLSCHQGATQRLGGHRVIPGNWRES